MEQGLIFGFVISFVSVVALIPPLRALALRIGFVDKPDESGGRKRHEALIPPIGGLVIFPVFIAVSSFVSGVSWFAHWSLLLGLLVLLAMGALDDKLHLSARRKFAVQLAIAVMLVVFGGAEMHRLGDLFGLGAFGLGPFSLLFSVAAVALLINAINLMDGLDGLAGGVALVAFFWLALAAFMGGRVEELAMLAPLMGAVLGFLVYNMRHPYRKRASVFLGDAGSLGLGLMLAWLCIVLAKDGEDHHVVKAALEPMSVAWIVALPVVDECAQFYRRVREGRHPFSADRGHFHHHLLHAGMRVGRATPLLLGLSFMLGAVGYLGALLGVPLFILTVTWVALLLSHMVLSRRTDFYVSLFSRLMPEVRD